MPFNILSLTQFHFSIPYLIVCVFACTTFLTQLYAKLTKMNEDPPPAHNGHLYKTLKRAVTETDYTGRAKTDSPLMISHNLLLFAIFKIHTPQPILLNQLIPKWKFARFSTPYIFPQLRSQQMYIASRAYEEAIIIILSILAGRLFFYLTISS